MRTNAILTALAVAWTGTVLAQGGDSPPQFPGPGMIRELKLTPEQVEKIKAIHEKNRSSNQSFRTHRAELRKAHQELRLAMQNDAPADELRRKHEAVQAALPKCEERQELARKRFEEILAIREILTPEQRKAFRGRMTEMRGGFGGRPGLGGNRRGGRGGPPNWDDEDFIGGD